MVLAMQMGVAQRQRLGLTQEIKSSLRYLALAGLRLEKTLQDVVDSNPFLNVSPTHSAHDDSDWIANLANPGPQSLAAALRALADDLFWHGPDRALADLLIDEVADTGLLTIPVHKITRPAGVSLAALRAIQDAFLSEGGLLADDLGQSLAAQARGRVLAGKLDPRHLEGILALCADLPGLRQGRLTPHRDTLAHLRALNPRPADLLDMEAAVILPPDLIVCAQGDQWAVQLNPLTHRAYALDTDLISALGPAAQKDTQIAEPLRAARATLRALQARGQTLIALTAFVCAHQDTALRQGRGHLKPLSQGDAAQALGLHPSTISRALAGKSVQTPRGLWPLKDFFTALIDPKTQFSGAQLSAWLTNAIAQENRASPQSDAALVTALAAQGITLARRTVTKYRLRQRLPSAHERARAYARAASISSQYERTHP